MTSIILGGFLYYLKIEFNFKSILYYHNINISYLIILFISPIGLYIFLKSLKALKKIKNYYYKVNIVINNYEFKLISFLDTGNKLIEPITNKPIILVNKKLIMSKIKIRSPMYVPITTINNHSLLEVIKPDKIIINNQVLNNYLVGLSTKKINMNRVECLLNYHILEDLND